MAKAKIQAPFKVHIMARLSVLLERFDKILDGIHFLSIDDLISINKILIELQMSNEQLFVRDKNLLASSQPRPNQYRYDNQTEDMFALSSVLIESIIKNHLVENSKKRTAIEAPS